MICYFGEDASGHFYDTEDGTRTYVSKDLWFEIVRASSQPAPVKGETLKLRIIETVTLDKFDGEVSPEGDLASHPAHVERVVFTPDESLVEIE